MIAVTLSEIKAHARIDGNVEDTLLEMYGESAEETVQNYIEKDFKELINEYGKIPVNVKHAILMLVAHSYAQREPASIQNLYTVPYTFDALLKPYMSL